MRKVARQCVKPRKETMSCVQNQSRQAWLRVPRAGVCASPSSYDSDLCPTRMLCKSSLLLPDCVTDGRTHLIGGPAPPTQASQRRGRIEVCELGRGGGPCRVCGMWAILKPHACDEFSRREPHLLRGESFNTHTHTAPPPSPSPAVVCLMYVHCAEPTQRNRVSTLTISPELREPM